jgi:hypothetical protein
MDNNKYQKYKSKFFGLKKLIPDLITRINNLKFKINLLTGGSSSEDFESARSYSKESDTNIEVKKSIINKSIETSLTEKKDKIKIIDDSIEFFNVDGELYFWVKTEINSHNINLQFGPFKIEDKKLISITYKDNEKLKTIIKELTDNEIKFLNELKNIKEFPDKLIKVDDIEENNQINYNFVWGRKK